MPIDFPNSPVSSQEFTSGQTTWIYDGTKWNIKAEVPSVNDSMPIGSLMWYAGSSSPAGWLACDGSAVSRSTYAALFAVLGTSYGAGNGSTTFNLPSIGASTGTYYIRHTSAIGVES